MSCITDKGFVRPSYDEILQAQINRAKVLLGDDIDTSEESVLGKFIRINVFDLNICYETLEDLYYSSFPNTARGQSLDRLGPFAAVSRNQATQARIEVKIKGTVGESVPSAFLLKSDKTSFYVVNDYTIDSNGEVVAIANCVDDGTVGNISNGERLDIQNPRMGIDSVEFIRIVQNGEELESDKDFRIRFANSLAGAGSSTESAIKGAIYRVPLVDGVSVIDNNSDTASSIPPHSFACYVLAPESQYDEIAKAIFDKKPLGIQCIGDIERTVYDAWGKPHTVKFFATSKADLKISMQIKTNQYFESSGISQIKDNIANFINNLANGSDVYYTSVFGYIHNVTGVVSVVDLKICKIGQAPGNSDIAIGEQEIARIDVSNISVEVV
nr:baseplate J/gp47 family protein [uncultured Lachnoanaerobaculum sp.]